MSEIDLTKAVGAQSPPIPQSWTKRDLLLFSNSIGITASSLHFLYELHPNFAAFPTYPVLCGFRHASDTDVVDFIARSSGNRRLPGVPALDYARVVDGERSLEVLRPIPVSSVGYAFELRSTCLGVYDKGKSGLVIETEQTLVDKNTGIEYTKIRGSSFAVGQGGLNGPKGPKKPNYPVPTDRSADHIEMTKLTDEVALLYRLNADYNPLHADNRLGQKMGFGGVIVHGLCTWNHAAVHVLRAVGGSDPANFKSFEARFMSPVLPGQTLVTSIWETSVDGDGFTEVRFVTKVKETGKVVLGNGRARIRKAAGKASEVAKL